MHHLTSKRAETTNFHFLSCVLRHNCVKIYRTKTNFELDLNILVKNLHMKYQLKMFILSKVKGQKLRMSQLNSKSTYILIRYNYISYLVECVQRFLR